MGVEKQGHQRSRLGAWLEAGCRDSRGCLLLTLFLGMLVWSMPWQVLILYGASILALWHFFSLSAKVVEGTCARTVKLCLFWAGMKLVVDFVTFLKEAHTAGLLSAKALAAACADFSSMGGGLTAVLGQLTLLESLQGAAGLFVRLLLLLFTAQALTALYSPRALGLAIAWLLRPVLREKAWQTALALTLMLRFLPGIHTAVAELRCAARVRGIPASGLGFWRIAIGRLFEILFQRTYTQATAVVVRHLDSDSAWQYPWRWERASIFFVVGTMMFFLLFMVLFLPSTFFP